MKKQFVLALLAILSSGFTRCQSVFALTTLPATGIGRTGATLHGRLDDDGGKPCECRFVCYGPGYSYTMYTAWKGPYESGDYFSAWIGGLTPATSYPHFVAQARWAENHDVIAWAHNFHSFVTLGDQPPPPEPETLQIVVSISGHLLENTTDLSRTASVPIHVEVLDSQGDPVQGAGVSLNDVVYGQTDVNGREVLLWNIPDSPPIEGVVDGKVTAYWNDYSGESEQFTLYTMEKLVEKPPITLTTWQAEISNLTRMLQYMVPKTPSPPNRIFLFFQAIFAFINVYTEYEARGGDVLTLEGYKCTAPDLSPAWLVHQTIIRDSKILLSLNFWTENQFRYYEGTGIEVALDSGHGMLARVASPVTLYVTDPNGLNAGYDPATGELLYDFPIWISEPQDEPFLLFIPDASEGQYQIQVIPEPNALPDDTYTLEVEVDGKNILLAQQIPISQIPEDPYVVVIERQPEPNEDGKINITEEFTGSDSDIFDLSYRAIMFSPVGEGASYMASVRNINQLPTDPTGGQTILLSDDDYEYISLSGQNTVSIYGSSFAGFYVGSNGYITFSEGDSDSSESLADHFDTPRVSCLFNDFDPSSLGTVSINQLTDRAVITWDQIPQYDLDDSSTFQVELYFDGRIQFAWLEVSALDGIVGLSNGQGLSVSFEETDLSELASTPYVYDIIIGDFENDVTNWGPTWEDSVLLGFSTTPATVTSGSRSLRVQLQPGAYWALQWNAPEVPRLEAGTQLVFDATMIQSEWTRDNWTQVANRIALNSDGPDGWKEYSPTAIDRVTGQPTSLDWGPLNPDARKTYSVDISDYDANGATWLRINISLQQNPDDGAGYFYIDNVRLAGL